MRVHDRGGRPGRVPEAAVRIELLTRADAASAVDLAVHVLAAKPGGPGEQFAADIAGERRHMFVAALRIGRDG
jgi:hypothetical protein